MRKEFVRDLIARYLNNEITATELQELKQMANAPDNEELSEVLEELWTDYEGGAELDANLKEEIYSKINTTLGIVPRTKKSYLLYFARVAAILIVMFVSYQFLSLYQDKIDLDDLTHHTLQVRTDKGQRTSLILPDSTRVLLNSESSIQYPINFGKSDRKLSLAGEAFFEVAKDANKKFIVSTEYLDIEVLGTTFNVCARSDVDLLEVNLLEGLVKVSSRGEGAEEMILTPNHKMIYNRSTNKMTIEESSHRLETSWIANKLVFRSTPLREVLEKLEKWYGVDIEANLSDTLLEDRFTGLFEKQEIGDVLKVLREYYNIDYKIFGHNVYITKYR